MQLRVIIPSLIVVGMLGLSAFEHHAPPYVPASAQPPVWWQIEGGEVLEYDGNDAPMTKKPFTRWHCEKIEDATNNPNDTLRKFGNMLPLANATDDDGEVMLRFKPYEGGFQFFRDLPACQRGIERLAKQREQMNQFLEPRTEREKSQ
jgi:hypothetical protein